MSVQAITWALGRAPNIASQAVLFSLANHANEWGITFVGQDTVATECVCRRPTVTANMARLEEDGLIARVRRHDGKGRRTSDVVVLGPLAADRGEMLDADKNAESMFSVEVCELARQGSDGEPRALSLGSDRASLGTDDESLGTRGVHEPSVEPSVEPKAPSSPSAARAWLGVPDEMRRDGAELLRQKVKVAGRVVTEPELETAAAALAEFNRQAESDFGLGANYRPIVMRIRERPSAGSEVHVRLVQSAWRLRWWERRGNGRRATPQVIYGERAFEQVWQDAADEAHGRKRRESIPLSERRFNGRRWDELTAREQEHAKEAASMRLEVWDGGKDAWQDRPAQLAAGAALVANGNGHAGGYSAETILDD